MVGNYYTSDCLGANGLIRIDTPCWVSDLKHMIRDNVYDQKIADLRIVVHYSPGQSAVDGVMKDNKEVARDFLRALEYEMHLQTKCSGRSFLLLEIHLELSCRRWWQFWKK